MDLRIANLRAAYVDTTCMYWGVGWPGGGGVAGLRAMPRTSSPIPVIWPTVNVIHCAPEIWLLNHTSEVGVSLTMRGSA